MTIQSNLYVEKVVSEHPVAVWMLNEQLDFLSLFTETNRQFYNTGEWTVSGATATQELSPPGTVPFSNSVTTKVTGTGTASQILLQQVSVFPTASLSTNLKNFVLSGKLYIGSTYGTSYSYGYQYDDTVSGLTYYVEETASILTKNLNTWVSFSNTFDLPNTLSATNIKIIFRINVSTGGTGSYNFYLNGFNLSQWSENFNESSLGISSSSISSAINLPNTLKTIPAACYGSSSKKAYYLATSNEMYAKNFGIPLVYGSSNVTKLYPNKISNVTYPSLIFPGYGFLNERGRHNEYTAEMWISLNTDASVPRKIFGSIASTDGLYVEGGFLTFVFNKQFASHYIGEWFRPMLIHIRYVKDSITVLLNGEEVISLSFIESDTTLPSEYTDSSKTVSNDWLGFYCYDDTQSFSIDSFAIYSYSVPNEVAKRRFVWGQGVSAPELQNSSLNATTAFADYAYSNNAVNYNYPDFANWKQGFFNNVVPNSNTLELPKYTLPSFNLGSKSTQTWYDAIQSIPAQTSTRTNLLYNPSLETSLSNWSAGSPMLLSQSSDYKHLGSYSLKTQATDYLSDTNIAMTNINTLDSVALSGKTITISAYIYCPIGSPFIGQTISISDEQPSTPPTTVSSINPTLVSGQWARVSKTMTYPSSVTAARTWVVRLGSQLPKLINRVNKFQDPSFESGTATYAGSYAGVGKTASYSNSTDFAYSGTKSIKYLAGTGKGTGSRYLSLVGGGASAGSVVPNTNMVFSQYVYCPVPISVSNYIDIYDSTPTYLSNIIGDATYIPANTWTKVYAKGSIPANASYSNLLLRESTVNGFPFRENLAINPSFETNVLNTGANSSSSSVRSTAAYLFGTASLLLTSNGGSAFGPYALNSSGLNSHIAVTAGQNYTWSAYIYDINTTKSYSLSIEWYNSSGGLISGSSGTTVASVVGAWTRLVMTATAPVGAVGATPTFYSTTAPTSGTQAYFDGFLFEQESKINYIQNGSFDVNLDGWYVLNPTNSAATFTRTTGFSYSGLASGLVTYTGTPTEGRTLRYNCQTSEPFKSYLPAGQYTVSAKVYGATGQGLTGAAIAIESNASPFATATSNSQTTATFNGKWQTISNTFTVTAAGNVVINVSYLGTPVNGNTFYIDEVMIETGSTVGTFVNSQYFDGSTGGTFQRWTGTAHASSSIDSPPVYVDGISMEVATSYNATANPCMKENTTGWTSNTSTMPATLTRLTGLTDVPDKRITTALNAESLADGSRIWNFLMGKVEGANGFFVAGQSYTMSFYAKLNSGSSSGYNMWFSNGPSLNNPASGVSFTPTSTWQRFSSTFTATSNFDYDTWWHIDMPQKLASNASFTGFMIEKSATLSSFADSSFFSGSTSGYAWKGTTNASASYEVAPLYVDSALAEISSTVGTYFDGSGSDYTSEYSATTAWLGTAHSSSSTVTYLSKLDEINGGRYLTFRPNSAWDSEVCSIKFDSFAVLNDKIESFYGIFQTAGVASDQTLFKVTSKFSSDYVYANLNNTTLTYNAVISGTTTIIATKTITPNQKFIAGINISNFASQSISGINKFFSNQKNLSLEVAGSGINTFTGKLYSFGFDGAYNNRKVNTLYDTKGIFSETLADANTLFAHTANYDLIPIEQYGIFFVDIAVAGYWEDYIPLSYFAKYIKDYDGNMNYDLDAIQFNIDYPEPIETSSKESISSWTYQDLYNKFNDPDVLSYEDLANTLYTTWDDYQDMSEDSIKYYYYDTSLANVRTYVSFQKIVDGSNKNLVDFTNFDVPRSKGTVKPSLSLTAWEDTAFELVDGSIVYPPTKYADNSDVDFNDLGLVSHVEFKVDGILHSNIKLRDLQLASQVYERTKFTEFGTKYGIPVYPYHKTGLYYDFKGDNPVEIYKDSTPHLFLTRHSGWRMHGEFGPSYDRGIAMIVNKEKDPGLQISSVQIWLKYADRVFPNQETKIFSITYKADILDFYVVADSTTQRGKVYAKLRSTDAIFTNLEFHLDGVFVENPYLINGEWACIGVAFPSLLDFRSYSGSLVLNGPMTYNNISYSISTNLEQQQSVEYNSWSYINTTSVPSGWDYWQNSFTWDGVKVLNRTNVYAIDPSDIFARYVGTNKVIVDDNVDGILLNPEQLKVYSDVSWSNTVATPV